MSAVQKDQRRADDEFVRIVQILRAIRKRIVWVIIAAVIAGVLAWIGSKMFITPKYQTLFRVYVNNALDTADKTSISNSDLSAARLLSTTYAEIIKGRTVLSSAAEKAGLKADYSQLSKMVYVSTSSSTEIITVTVTTTSPALSKQYAECIIDVAKNQVSGIVDGSSMRVIDDPYLPQKRNSPNYRRNALSGAFIGAFIVLLIITLRALLDNRVRDEQTLEERFGYAILGSIPNQNAAGRAGKNYSSYGYGGAEREAQK